MRSPRLSRLAGRAKARHGCRRCACAVEGDRARSRRAGAPVRAARITRVSLKTSASPGRSRRAGRARCGRRSAGPAAGHDEQPRRIARAGGWRAIRSSGSSKSNRSVRMRLEAIPQRSDVGVCRCPSPSTVQLPQARGRGSPGGRRPARRAGAGRREGPGGGRTERGVSGMAQVTKAASKEEVGAHDRRRRDVQAIEPRACGRSHAAS